MELVYSKRAVKAIEKINNPLRKRVKDALEKLPAGDVKKLQGFKSVYRLRVGDYRILFEMGEVIEVLDVLPRGEAYKD